MDRVRRNAYGKINLGLDVVGRRPDGYHLVKMILQTVNLFDEVIVRRQDEGITVKTNKPYLPCDERNLAYKAARLMLDHFDLPGGVRIDIGKNIPVAAGMAGGSTDAAAVMQAIKTLYGLKTDAEEMDALAVKLGADVPFCLRRGTYLAEGIGEKLTKLPPMPHCFCLLVNPGFGVSTKKVYEKIDEIKEPDHPDIDRIIRGLERNSAEEVALSIGNILELAVLPDHPVIGEIKERMMEYGALSAMMSGSGATVFGLYHDRKQRDEAFMAFEGDSYGRFKVEF